MKTMLRTLLTTACISICYLFMSQSVFSQEVIEVKSLQAQMSKGTQPCYQVNIPEADMNTVQKNWIKKIQESTKIKVIEKDQELLLAGVVKKELTSDTINIYSLIIPKENYLELNVFYEIDSVFFKPNEDKTDLASEKIDSSIKKYLLSFATEQYRLVVKKELEGEQNELETMQADLEKLIKEEENLRKDNASLETDIEDYEREVAETDKNIELKNQEILNHTLTMQTITGEEARKVAEDDHKDLEKEKKQLVKDRGKAKEGISDSKSKIEKNTKAIEESLKDQEAKKEEIEIQTEVVKQVEEKLEGIK